MCLPRYRNRRARGQRRRSPPFDAATGVKFPVLAIYDFPTKRRVSQSYQSHRVDPRDRAQLEQDHQTAGRTAIVPALPPADLRPRIGLMLKHRVLL
jgi:hypothetical protein